MKKIMFNDKYGLTQAVLEGRKTQTRRIADTAGRLRDITVRQALEEVNKGRACLFDEGRPLALSVYKLGETIAIAQKYADLAYDGEFFRLLGKVIFEKGCHNKMFVKADFMPHRIRITNIRVERLQDISDEDCIAEGIYPKANGRWYCYDVVRRMGVSYDPYPDPREAYAALIDKISDKGTWESNPWVFVYDFELVK